MYQQNMINFSSDIETEEPIKDLKTRNKNSRCS